MNEESFEELLNKSKKEVERKDYRNAIKNLIFAAGMLMLEKTTKPIVEILNKTLERVKKGDCKNTVNDLEFAIIILEQIKEKINEQERQDDVYFESQKLWVIRELGRQK